VRQFGQRILDTQGTALLAGRGLAPLQRFRCTLLEFGRDIIVQTLNGGDFVGLDVSHFLQAGEAFGNQQLGQRLVDVQLVWNISDRSTNSRWRFSEASASVRMSIWLLVSCEARRTFWPRRPIARLSWSSGTTTSIRPSSSSMTTRATVAGWRALTTKVAVSSDQGMMSIFSPCISCTTAWTRLPFMPTQAPTGSIELS
jgi:hypothetical protein